MPRTRTEAKKRTILDAASKVFSERDFHEVLVDDVAERARVGKGTVYRYFETKEDLYFATVLRGFTDLSDVLAASLPLEASPSRRLERIAAEILRVFWNRRSFYALIHRSERRFRLQQRQLLRRREKVVGLVQEILADGIARREFRGIDPRVGAELFMGMVRSSLFNLREVDTIPALARHVVHVFVDGIGRETRS